MSLLEKIDKRLENYSTYGEDEFGYDQTDCRKDLVSDIISLILEEMPKDRTFVEHSEPNPMIDAFSTGWNAHRTAMIKMLKGEL